MGRILSIIPIMHHLTRQVAFEASHYCQIPKLSGAENFALFGAAANPNGHGHNYVLEATVKGVVDPEHGMVVNIANLDTLLKERVIQDYDHKLINRQHPVFANNPDLQPTCENLAIQIWRTIELHLREAILHRVRLYEDSSTFADYYGEEMMVYHTKVYEFSASHRLHSIELGDTENQQIFGKCNNPHGHGHNYVLEVMIKGEVNPRTGLVTDLGFLDRTIEEQIYTRFDFKHLNLDTSEFETINPTSENFVKVLWDILKPHLKPVELYRLRLRETPRSYFDYYGEQSLTHEN